MGYRAERPMAAAAHLMVLLGTLGLVGTGALFALAHAQGLPFARAHARQALAYQLAVAIGLALLGAVGLGSVLGGLVLGVLHLLAMAYGAFVAMCALDPRAPSPGR